MNVKQITARGPGDKTNKKEKAKEVSYQNFDRIESLLVLL